MDYVTHLKDYTQENLMRERGYQFARDKAKLATIDAEIRERKALRE